MGKSFFFVIEVWRVVKARAIERRYGKTLRRTDLGVNLAKNVFLSYIWVTDTNWIAQRLIYQSNLDFFSGVYNGE